MESNQRVQEARQFWDREAATFDNESDHGLLDPEIRREWTSLLAQYLPATPISILDIGCGTGSLSVVMAAMGHHVTGIDLSEAMIGRAESKARLAELSISFKVMDAYNPQFSKQQFEAIVCRHLLWAMPEPTIALTRWSKFLAPSGQILMIEGFWHTEVGLRAIDVVGAMPSAFTHIEVQNLSQNEQLWGEEMHDERYIVVADYTPNRIQFSNPL